MVVLIAAVTAGAVVLAGGGAGFWLCVPAALLAAAWSRTRPAVALNTAAVVAAAGVPALIDHRPLPPAALAVAVPMLSAAVLVAVRERLERERDALRESALTDPLTGIANRRSLLARIEYEIARHARTRHGFAVVMIDLDGFKGLNDRFGHAAGDDLLRDVASALEHTVRGQDTVARMGGDEFCVLAPETEGEGVERLRTRVEWAVTTVTAGVQTLQASVGVASFPGDGRRPQDLLEAADQRLLAAKRALGSTRVRRRAA
jgi:diguanylate cyclase (GGDEF)-like protein